MNRFLLSVGAALALLAACQGEAEEQKRADIGRISNTLRALRDADNAAKRPHLKRLETQTCAAAEACRLRDTCVAAYREHIAALDAAGAVRAALGSDAGATELARAAVLAEVAEQKLKSAKPQIDTCTALDAELSRKVAR